MGYKVLTVKQVDWAYKKWCEGYTKKQIADALFCGVSTLDRYLAGMPRIRPKLTYSEEVGSDGK